jgi:hypothetical protein
MNEILSYFNQKAKENIDAIAMKSVKIIKEKNYE